MDKSTYTNYGSLSLAIGIPLVGGMLSGLNYTYNNILMCLGLSSRDAVKGWYKTLVKPSWTPPPKIYGPVLL